MKRILVVDDNVIGRRLASVVLSDRGFAVEEVASGEEALERISERHFDCVLMDISMPGMSGTEAVERIRAVPETADLYVVGYTAHAMSEDIQRFLASGFDHMLIKPITGDKIADLIEKI